MSLFDRPARVISEYVTRFPYVGAEEDTQGNRVETFGTGERAGIFVFDPGGSTEPRTDGRDPVVTEPVLYVPYDTPFEEHDECLARGKRYAAVGATARHKHPTDGEKVAVVKLRRVDG